jgi:hypothetical protein
MSVLFTMAWDIIPGKEDEYADFIAGTFLPETSAMKLAPVGGYYVEVGFGPRVIGVSLASDLELLSRVIASDRFKQLSVKLKSIVHNYRTAVLEPTGRVKREKYAIQKGVWKLNQYYDLKPGVKKEYADFIVKEYLPAIQKIDYMEVTGGWNVVLGGVSEIISEFTFKDPVDIGRLLNNEEFRKLNLKLKGAYVMNYASRILRCTERFDEPKWFRL